MSDGAPIGAPSVGCPLSYQSVWITRLTGLAAMV